MARAGLVLVYALAVALLGATLVHTRATDQWMYLPLIPVFIAAFLQPRWVYLAMLVVLCGTAWGVAVGLEKAAVS